MISTASRGSTSMNQRMTPETRKASAQVFLYPPTFDVRMASKKIGLVRERHLYVIRNARLDPDWAETERWTLSILTRSVTSLIQTQGVGDLYRIYLAAQRDGFDYNLAYIPRSFTRQLQEPFHTAYMRELFDVGYNMALKGYSWAKAPPGYTAPQIEPPVSPPQPAS
jgi:hypothetical protein